MKKILPLIMLTWFLLAGFGPNRVNPAAAMEFWEARHLLSRTGFGVKQTELSLMTSLNYTNGIDLILVRSSLNRLPVTPLPDWHNAVPADYRPEPGVTEDEIRAIQLQMRHESIELQLWWNDLSGLHPQLEPLLNWWNQGNMAIIEGLGYEDPNLSHFRSIDIWDSASLSDEFISEGWLGRLFAEQDPPDTLFADGIAISSNELGPLAGPGRNVLSLSSPEDFLAKAQATPHLDLITDNSSLDHVIEVQNEVSQAVDKLAEALAQGNPLTTEFPTTGLGRDLGYVAQLLACGLQVPAFKVSLGGFDTHSNQKNSHENLLSELAQGLDLFCQALKEAGLWDRVLICTYSEFGRRAG